MVSYSTQGEWVTTFRGALFEYKYVHTMFIRQTYKEFLKLRNYYKNWQNLWRLQLWAVGPSYMTYQAIYLLTLLTDRQSVNLHN
jgi:hypothetical protein